MAVMRAIIAAVVAIVIWCVSVDGRCVHLRIVRNGGADASTVVLIEMTANPMRIIVIVVAARMDDAIRLRMHAIGIVIARRWHYGRHSDTAAVVHVSIVMVMVVMVKG